MTDAERREIIDAELEQLRKDGDVDLVQLVEMMVGNGVSETEKLARVAAIMLRHQRVTHALQRHILGELRLLRDDVKDAIERIA